MKQNLTYCQINVKTVITTQIWIHLTTFRNRYMRAEMKENAVI